MGVPWQDPRAQVEHLVNELNGSHRHVLDALKRGPDTIEAGERTWTKRYEVAGKPHHDRRIAHGYGFARALGDAPANPVAPATSLVAQARNPGAPQRPQGATPFIQSPNGFAGFQSPSGNQPLIPRMIEAFTRAIPGDPMTTGTIIPASFTPEAPQAPQEAPQAAPQPFQAPAPPQPPQGATPAPQAAPSIPNGFLPPSFADVAGITPNDPTPLGARNGMVQVGGESDARRAPSFSDGYFGRAPEASPMTIAPQGDRQYTETDFDPGPGPAENPLVVRGIRPKAEPTPAQPQPQMVPLPPQRPSNDQLFPQPQATIPGMPQAPVGSTPTIWGATYHGPESGWINHAQKPAGTPYPEAWQGGNPYPSEGNLLKLLGLV